MNTKDFYYDLPEELIAQKPLENRTDSRLMVLSKETGEITHKHFYDVIDYLNEGDCLVMNNTRVIPARLYGQKEGTGGKIEFLLLKRIDINTWEVILKPGRKAKVGSRFEFGGGLLKAEILEVIDDGNRIVRFEYEGIWEELLDKLGEMPLPPYIHEKLNDRERYQTVYSKIEGSAAAPTAGLHFTNELMEKIRAKGIKIAFVTLHVGLGTFRPVLVENVENHKMHSEYYEVSEETAKIVNETRKNGGRIIAVGTTSVRTLESVADENGQLKKKGGNTEIFIYPGYKFKAVDALITNFHLPESTLLMLISAFSDKEKIFNAYGEAIKEKYRFFSFGDAMFII
ncbi:MAG: tRNA preQ1(34) S-adenosylmethionine ribosyltransferase-isomerase QueA [Ruminococcaceae bacterium]|nr:tRNA preQ1(34) S-adenosylmethionine ribosyltransferase-isomerase QueA [Oscillospiraceae bacterium]